MSYFSDRDQEFPGSDDCEASFQKLKTSLTTIPVLVSPSSLGMYTEGQVITYASCQLKIHEKNYPVHDLELAAIVHALKIWRHYLYGIKAQQFDDPHLVVLREAVLQGSAKEVSIGEDGVLRLQGRLCVPNSHGLRERILEEAHSLRYSIHPGATKMYRDLRKHYWWRRIKMDILGLTKSAHFIPIVTTYTPEILAQIYIREIVRLHGVPVSIVSDRGPQFTSHF
ncbi:uncharacterized protein [Nicotiana sylvestris]|uniref:uncharacterized protein n=1 Tax=Nicotiana sylvestris TaxID=4096 RepID=UPI00388CB624